MIDPKNAVDSLPAATCSDTRRWTEPLTARTPSPHACDFLHNVSAHLMWCKCGSHVAGEVGGIRRKGTRHLPDAGPYPLQGARVTALLERGRQQSTHLFHL